MKIIVILLFNILRKRTKDIPFTGDTGNVR